MSKLTVCVFGVAAAFSVLAFVRPEPPTNSAAVRAENEKLAGAMDTIGSSVKAIAAGLKTPDELDKVLPEAWKAQHACLDAKSELPETVTGVEDEKAKHKAELAYRTQMQDLLRAFLDVESAVLAGDAKKAEKALRQTETLKSAGHSQFKPREGK